MKTGTQRRWVTWPLAAWVSFLALAVLTLYQMGQG